MRQTKQKRKLIRMSSRIKRKPCSTPRLTIEPINALINMTDLAKCRRARRIAALASHRRNAKTEWVETA
jgi:hypothetical protein